VKNIDMNIGISDNPNPAPDYFKTETFANPLNLDANESNAFYCEVTGNTTLNLLNSRLGATYLIQLNMDASGGHTVTMGELFRGVVGTGAIDTSANAVNLISVFRTKGGFLTYSVISVDVETTTTSTTTTTTTT
jgi:hypothetical protein